VQFCRKLWVLIPNFQGGANARFDSPADAYGFDVPRVQNCLLEFSVKAHPQYSVFSHLHVQQQSWPQN